MKVANENSAGVRFCTDVTELQWQYVQRVIDAQAARIAKLEAQIPDGMKHCTIRFIACPVGHGRLTAINWQDSGCLMCKRDAANARADAAERNARQFLKDYNNEHATGMQTHAALERAEAESAALRAVAEAHVKDNVSLGEENAALRADVERWKAACWNQGTLAAVAESSLGAERAVLEALAGTPVWRLPEPLASAELARRAASEAK